jgi:hypothetical protein
MVGMLFSIPVAKKIPSFKFPGPVRSVVLRARRVLVLA